MKPVYNSDRRGPPKGGKRFGSGGSRFGGGAPWKRGEDRDGDRPPLHDAICGDCGAECQVPFRPTGSRPVLCRNCFKKDGGSAGKPSFEKRPFQKSFGGGDNKIEERLRFIEVKLDRILAALEGGEEKLF